MSVGALVCRTAVDFVVFVISILDVIGWDFITMWTYLVSQNESDGGDWEGKASVASGCSIFYALHLLKLWQLAGQFGDLSLRLDVQFVSSLQLLYTTVVRV